MWYHYNSEAVMPAGWIDSNPVHLKTDTSLNPFWSRFWPQSAGRVIHAQDLNVIGDLYS
jgi:hypothetical protein